eukprot:Gregarina_sp_Pseudo_9__3979@NODE_411_length_2894_cov_28_431524_g388_i0_p2_GENE_NODE_411_length_2894_cov_28_431524_g388_i0NODE_411_length_2894_cov_28_431524_g388_i0_p2_ORF_typecomplete_len410_score61_78NAD_Gly3P_dh_N/PF01210_23/1e43NAD_Gly3P_dh_C/PF07479_14/3e42F420_oxidored/PF03807_17/0_026Rossmannlike/PF10727_9/0_59_NODE_411_length_2894_cov_28_431524_g388_i02751504
MTLPVSTSSSRHAQKENPLSRSGSSMTALSVTQFPSAESAPDLRKVLRNGAWKITLVGAGNWATAVGIVVAENALESYMLDERVRVFVHDEQMPDGRMLSQHINEDHVNSKYLPGIQLPENLVAEPNLIKAIDNADLLIFAIPQQYILSVCHQLVGHVKRSARGISLVKGIWVENNQPQTFSNVIYRNLGIECSALSGANLAVDVATRQFAEASIGYSDLKMAFIWQQVFDRPYFRIATLPDTDGVQLCGALKSVVALAVGFCSGLGLKSNTKAAIARIGFDEMRLFSFFYFDNVLEETFFGSAGVGDLLTTSYGGRNVLCAAEFVRRGGKSSWEEIEADVLNGQRLQGPPTVANVYNVLQHYEVQKMFPLFKIVYEISFRGRPCGDLVASFTVSGDGTETHWRARRKI